MCEFEVKELFKSAAGLTHLEAGWCQLDRCQPSSPFLTDFHVVLTHADCLFVPLQGASWRPRAVEGAEECSTQVCCKRGRTRETRLIKTPFEYNYPTGEKGQLVVVRWVD